VSSPPDDPLERSRWYRAKAEHARGLAADAPLASIRDSYRKLAKTHETLAEDAEELHRARSDDKPT
jgi:hypothetical protein